MTTFEQPHILVGLHDHASARAAAEWAAAEADRRHLALRLVTAYVAPAEVYPGGGLAEPDLVGMARSWAVTLLRDSARSLGRLYPGLPVQTAARYGHASTVLVEESREATITVIGTHGTHHFAEALLGSVAIRLAAHSASPVVIVRSGEDVGAQRDGGRVVVGIDDSPEAQAAIGFAFEAAAVHGCQLEAVHVWDEQAVMRAAAAVPLAPRIDAVRDDIFRMLAEQVAGWTEKYPDVPVRQIVETGHPAERLVAHCAAAAGGPANLLVVGSRGRGGFAGLLLGSTSATVIAHATCPVAVIRNDSWNDR